jgi:hypothetical protein
MENNKLNISSDIGQEIILLLQEINSKMENLIKKQNEKKLQSPFLDRNRA